MYTLSQRQNKLVARTRLTQNYDQIESIRKIKNAINGHTANNGTATTENGNNNITKSMDINTAKPVFQQYRRSSSHRNSSLQTVRISGFNDDNAQPQPSPEYEEMIRFIKNSWNILSNECSDTDEALNESDANCNESAGEKSSGGEEQQQKQQQVKCATAVNGVNQSTTSNRRPVIVYHNEPASPDLDGFGAFDLESWWGRRLFNNITKNA